MLGYAPLELPSGQVLSIVDVPGHEKLVRTMLSGMGGIDLTLLAVSARAGVMPQTREHLNACRLLGVKAGVVALTFSDLVDDVDAAMAEVREQLRGSLLETAPIIPVSAPTGQGIKSLLDALQSTVRGVEEDQSQELPVCLPVDRVFTVDGFGTIVTGSLLRGSVTVGDEVEILPGGNRARVRGLQVHGQSVEAATAGCRVAANLVIDRGAVDVRALLTQPGAMRTGRVFDAALTWLAHAPRPLLRRREATLHLGGSFARADVRADVAIQAGSHGVGRVRLDRDLPLPPGARFVLRGNPIAGYGGVIGGGVILDTHPARKGGPAIRTVLAESDGEAAQASLIARSGRHGLSERALAQRLPLPWPATDSLLYAPTILEAERRALLSQVARYHQEHPLEIGVARHHVAVDELSKRVLTDAIHDGALRRLQGLIALPTHKVDLDPAREALARKVMRAVGKAGLNALSEAELKDRFPAGPAAIREVIEHLERIGRLVRAGGFCFPGREVEVLRRAAAAAVLAGEGLPVAWLKDHASLSRKYAMPLWTWLDSTGVTLRRGDVRIAGPRAREFLDER
jgi:selenocysteine-specific elongation factor